MTSSIEISSDPYLFMDAWDDAPIQPPLADPANEPSPLLDNALFFGSHSLMHEVMQAAQGKNWINSQDMAKMEREGLPSPKAVASAVSPTSRAMMRAPSSKSKAFEVALFAIDMASQGTLIKYTKPLIPHTIHHAPHPICILDLDPAFWLRELAQACAQARQVLCLLATQSLYHTDLWAAGLHGSLLCAEREYLGLTTRIVSIITGDWRMSGE
ncbi:hypothetical protein EON64_02250, partial [archaeon]